MSTAETSIGPYRHLPHLGPVVLRTDTGDALALDPARWHGPATDEEQDLLADVDGPVIDLGCGPGRLVVNLAHQRVPPSASTRARRPSSWPASGALRFSSGTSSNHCPARATGERPCSSTVTSASGVTLSASLPAAAGLSVRGGG